LEREETPTEIDLAPSFPISLPLNMKNNNLINIYFVENVFLKIK
jgi:hypothetical protein